MEKTQPKSAAQQASRASSHDVIGAVPGELKVNSKWGKHYRLLKRARDIVLKRQQDKLRQAAEEAPLLQENLAELGTDEFDRNLALGIASAEQDVLNEIDQALRRIQEGTYGVCELTGKPIDPARLEAIPWTRFSSEAERKLEAEGQIHHASLGKREAVPKESS